MSLSNNSSARSPAVCPKIRIGAVIFARRSSVPSSRLDTAKRSAPFCKNTLDNMTAPCPYASALTTAVTKRSFPVMRRISRIFSAALSKSISAQTGRFV